METKVCKHCLEEKYLDLFKKDNRNSDGRGSICKFCHNAQNREYYSRPEVSKSRSEYRAWYRSDPIRLQKKRDSNRKWQLESRRLETDEKRKRRNQRHNIWRRKDYLTNPMKYKSSAMKRKYNSSGSFSQKDWIDLCLSFDNYCVCCWKQTSLTPDHVIPLVFDGKNSIENIQPLCLSCNSRKAARHQRDYRPAARILLSYMQLHNRGLIS